MGDIHEFEKKRADALGIEWEPGRAMSCISMPLPRLRRATGRLLGDDSEVFGILTGRISHHLSNDFALRFQTFQSCADQVFLILTEIKKSAEQSDEPA